MRHTLKTGLARMMNQGGRRNRPTGMGQSYIEGLEARMLLSAAVVEIPSFIIVSPTTANFRPAASTGVRGLTPAQIDEAYGINQVSINGVAGNGAGQTIAIVDAYNAPTIVSDLHAFDLQFGLSDPALLCINQTGGTSLPGVDPSGKGNSWAVESSLDVEWVHAVAPKAAILLVEANSASDIDLFAAINTARVSAGVSVVSMSWGGGESASQNSYNQYFTTPAGHIGVTFLAASGDSGAYDPTTGQVGVNYPASSPNVISVGGTSLTTTGAGNYVSESGWGNGTQSLRLGGSGGGISSVTLQPTYQQGVVTQSSTYRALPDVAMVADPSSGVAVYDSYDFGTSSPWVQVGGTSLATPLWAGVAALADQAMVAVGGQTLDGATQMLPRLYALPSTAFHDVTTGSNGPYSAGAGFDLVTGRGTPIVNVLVADLAGTTPVPPPTPVPTPSTPTIGSLKLSASTVTVGATDTLTAQNVSETGGTIAQVAFYQEIKPSQGPKPIQDILIGYGTAAGSNWSVAMHTAGMAAGSYTVYAIATDGTGNSSAPVTGGLVVQAAPAPTPPPPPAPTPTPPSTKGPTIGTLKVSQATITVGTTLTLTAGNVTDAAARVVSVAFYRELTPAQGAVPTSDHLIGYGHQAGSSWVITADTSKIAPGTYTLYAIATDRAGATSAVVTVTVTVLAPPAAVPPVIGALQVSSASVTAGQTITFTISNVSVPTGGAVQIALYTEGDPTQGPQPATDYFIGLAAKNGAGWTLAAGTSTTPAGVYTIYAVATDVYGNVSAPVSVTVTVLAATGSGGTAPGGRHWRNY